MLNRALPQTNDDAVLQSQNKSDKDVPFIITCVEILLSLRRKGLIARGVAISIDLDSRLAILHANYATTLVDINLDFLDRCFDRIRRLEDLS